MILGSLHHCPLVGVGGCHYHANRDEIEADLAEEETEYSKLLALHKKPAE